MWTLISTKLEASSTSPTGSFVTMPITYHKYWHVLFFCRVGASCTQNDRRFDVSTEGRVYKFHVVGGGAGAWKTAITSASYDYIPRDSNENVRGRANRSFSVTSIPTVSPVKMAHRTPQKSATFLATNSGLTKTADKHHSSREDFSSPVKKSTLIR